MNQSKLSADPIALIFGIISVLIVFLGCCCGLFILVSLGLGIAGIVMANRSLREYYQTPENFFSNSKSNVGTGKILCIIGTVLSSLMALIYIVYFIIMGTMFSDAIRKNYKKNKFEFHTTDTLSNGSIRKNDSITKIDTVYSDTTGIIDKTVIIEEPK